MLDILQETKLADGRNVRITRIVTPEPNVPERAIRYLMGSLSFEKYRQYVKDQAYWRLYDREALDGHTADTVTDYFYFAEVDGQFAARLWFAYNKRSGFGNFGNVYTEAGFRRLGLMTMLLKPCVEDFHASGAKMLCCATGNVFAANSYRKVGFKTIYGGETGPMTITKVDFFEEDAKAFPGNEPLTIRPGTPGDQFDIDKFLAYSKAMYGFPRCHHVGIAAHISDYRIAFQEHLSGNGPINVAVTPSGYVVGFAYALNYYGETVLDFTTHPSYTENAAELLNRTAAEFEGPQQPLLYIHVDDTERHALALKAGFSPVATIPERYSIYQVETKG